MNQMTCDIKLNSVSANSWEGAQQIKLRDVVERIEHRRDLVVGVILKDGSGCAPKMLEMEEDKSHNKEMAKKEKESISLDACFKAYSREELLSGTDQWYCNKCKEQRDIHKKLELYRLPKILII